MLSAADLYCASRVLSAELGEVELSELTELRPNRVVRCSVAGPAQGAPSTVIVKVADRGDDPHRGIEAIRNEYAALSLLDGLNSESAARLLAADPESGVLVLEDLGDGPSLCTALLGHDAVAASEAAVASATTLGRLHAQTIGHADAFAELRRRSGHFDREEGLLTLRGLDLRDGLRKLPSVLVAHHLPSIDGCDDDLEAMVEELRSPGGFLSLSSGDPCPDNERLIASGARFFDFEAAAFRHALVDAAHYVIPFPNCWCWAALPEDLATRMLAAHRNALCRGCPESKDDDRYEQALVTAVGAWVIWTLARRIPFVSDRPRMRARIIEAVRRFATRAKRAGALLSFAEFCDRMTVALTTAWPDARAETYPAFGGSQWQHSQ